MEPDFIRDQVKNIWLVLAANAKLIKEKNLKIEGAFVDCEFVVQQAAALYDAVADSVNIKAVAPTCAHQYIIMKPDFLSQQGKSLQAAIEDSVQLQDLNKTCHTGLVTLSDTFVMAVVTNLRDVIVDNVAVAVRQKIQPNVLFMARPNSVERLVASFHCVLTSQICQKRWVGALQELRLAAEQAHSELKAQFEVAITEKAEALSKVAALEASLAAVEQDYDRLQASAKESADAAQARITKLEEEMGRLSTEHLGYDSKAHDRDLELARLKDEHATLVKTCEEQCDAIALAVAQNKALSEEKENLVQDRDRLTAELAKVQEASETFALARAKEHEHMIAEVSRLEEALKTRVDEMTSQAEERMSQLKASVDAAKAELLTADNQLSATIIQCDTWKATLDDVLTRQATEMEEVRQIAARDKDIADGLLSNSVKKIEELEILLRQKDAEISQLREVASQQAAKPLPVKVPASPPPSSRKRSFPGHKKSATPRTTQGGGCTIDLSSHGSPMPSSRVQELATFPEVAVDLGTGQDAPAIFSRQSLSNILGGSVQGLVVRCTESATDLARKHDIQDYLCPNMDHNAWCPAGPGKHGYMQVGLGRDRKLFNEGGDYRHVFVGAGKHFLYCGWYHVQRVDPLTKEEWATLPLKVQQTYSETTVNKEKSGLLKSGKQVLGMYNSGKLRAPCVRLRCVGFDTAFYQELVRANDQFFENKPRPMPPPAAGGPGPSKRRRITTMVDAGKGDESEDEVNLALVAKPRKSVSGSAPLPALPTPPATQTPSGSVAPLSDAAKVSADDRSPSIPLASVVTMSSAALPARSTRSQSRRQTVSLKLRIPGGKSTDPTPQLEGDDFGDSDSSAGSEDDDMYAD